MIFLYDRGGVTGGPTRVGQKPGWGPRGEEPGEKQRGRGNQKKKFGKTGFRGFERAQFFCFHLSKSLGGKIQK